MNKSDIERLKMSIDEIAQALRICNRTRGHRCSECPVFSKYEHKVCKSTVDRLAADVLEGLKEAGHET